MVWVLAPRAESRDYKNGLGLGPASGVAGLQKWFGSWRPRAESRDYKNGLGLGPASGVAGLQKWFGSWPRERSRGTTKMVWVLAPRAESRDYKNGLGLGPLGTTKCG